MAILGGFCIVTEHITLPMVEARARDLAAISVNQTVSLLKGGIFALAAVVLIEIAFAPDDRVVRAVLWTATLFMAMTSYNAWLSSAVTLFREGVRNVIAIIAQGMIELMMFAVLTPRSTPQAWRYWLLVHAAFALVTGLRLAVPMNEGASPEPALVPLFDHMAKNRKDASRGILVNALASVLIAWPVMALSLASPWPRWLCLSYGLFNIGYTSFAMFQQEQTRATMERILTEARPNGPPESRPDSS